MGVCFRVELRHAMGNHHAFGSYGCGYNTRVLESKSPIVGRYHDLLDPHCRHQPVWSEGLRRSRIYFLDLESRSCYWIHVSRLVPSYRLVANPGPASLVLSSIVVERKIVGTLEVNTGAIQAHSTMASRDSAISS